MPIKLFPKFAGAALVLSYPLLAHWLLTHWTGASAAPAIVLLAPPTLFNFLLACIFGATLRAGREPMVTAFARLEHAALNGPADAPLPAELAAYTRVLTQLWCALFLIMTAISAWLAYAGPHAWWALFTGLISYLLMGALFFGEYLLRRLRYTHYRHAQPFRLIWILIKSGPLWMQGRR